MHWYSINIIYSYTTQARRTYKRIGTLICDLKFFFFFHRSFRYFLFHISHDEELLVWFNWKKKHKSQDRCPKYSFICDDLCQISSSRWAAFRKFQERKVQKYSERKQPRHNMKRDCFYFLFFFFFLERFNFCGPPTLTSHQIPVRKFPPIFSHVLCIS